MARWFWNEWLNVRGIGGQVSLEWVAECLWNQWPNGSGILTLISSLEQELGMALFERQRGRLIRNPEAKFFLQETEAVLDRLNHASRTMRELGNLKEGRLRIACMPASAQFMLPRLVADFVADKPQVKVSLMMRASDVIEEWIASQQYDIGFGEKPPANSALETIDFELSCVCALRHDDPLAQNSVITPQDLSGNPLAVLQEDHPSYIATRDAFDSVGAELISRFELRNFQPALTLVEEQLCYCICDPITASSYFDYHQGQPNLVFRPFVPHVPLHLSILLPAHRPASLLARAFVGLLAVEVERIQQQFV